MSGAKPDKPNTELAAEPHRVQTATLIVETLRQVSAIERRDFARGQLIETLAGCGLCSSEIDGLFATIKLMAEALVMVQHDSGDVVAARFATMKH